VKKLIIIGGAGNGTVILSTVEDINDDHPQWEILGFLNDFETQPINGYPVLGKIDRSGVDNFLKYDDVFFLFTLISTKFNHHFIHRLVDLEIPQQKFATIIHPTAVVSRFSQIGRGVMIQPFVSIGPNVQLGDHIQVYAQAFIGHNSRLADYAYVANNACVGAAVHLCEGAYLGTNSSTLENVTLGKWSLVGMGSVVIHDVPGFAKVVGNPAKVIGTTR
jgi:acetyltransferase EpsM